LSIPVSSGDPYAFDFEEEEEVVEEEEEAVEAEEAEAEKEPSSATGKSPPVAESPQSPRASMHSFAIAPVSPLAPSAPPPEDFGGDVNDVAHDLDEHSSDLGEDDDFF
jgi:hypothetical protein